jgi:hypothetical protein
VAALFEAGSAGAPATAACALALASTLQAGCASLMSFPAASPWQAAVLLAVGAAPPPARPSVLPDGARGVASQTAPPSMPPGSGLGGGSAGGAAAAGGSGSAPSAAVMLVSPLRQTAPSAARRLRISHRSWRASFLVLIPERPD